MTFGTDNCEGYIGLLEYRWALILRFVALGRSRVCRVFPHQVPMANLVVVVWEVGVGRRWCSFRCLGRVEVHGCLLPLVLARGALFCCSGLGFFFAVSG